MEETIALGIIALVVIILMLVWLTPVIARYVIPGIYYGAAIGALYLFYLLDRLFSVRLIPRLPWVMWGIWGGLIGVALACWSVAPRYGLRDKRRWIICSPLILMLAVLCISSLIRWLR